MIKLLSIIGQKASYVLILGLVLAAFLPILSILLRPALPFFVSLVLGLAIARLDVLHIIQEFMEWKKSLLLAGIVVLFMPATCIIIVCIWRQFDLDDSYILLLVVFAASPPLSSATSLSLLLGYNSRLTLQVTLLATLFLPILGPLCFSIVGLNLDLEMLVQALRIAIMIFGGFLLGICIQIALGKGNIERNKDAFNGVVTLAMILFLFPLFDGVFKYVFSAPLQSFMIFILAFILNIFGNLFIRWISKSGCSMQTANALGLMFGNRNLSFYLAVLPLNPLLSMFVATSQIPMFLTPTLFREQPPKLDKF